MAHGPAGCGSCASRRGRSVISPRRLLPSANAKRSPEAIQAGAARMYEVMSAAGRSTGRRFNTYIGAESFAKRIGGTVRPL